MKFSVFVSSFLLISSACASSASNKQQELGSSESRGYSASSHPSSSGAPAAYEPREPEAVYSSKNNRGYESNEQQDPPSSHEDYAPKAPAKKTVILAIPVKLALQHADREKATSSYESSGESYGSRAAYPTSYASYADQAGKIEPGNSHAETWSRASTSQQQGSTNIDRQPTNNQNNNNNSYKKLQHEDNERFREQDFSNNKHNYNLNHFTFKSNNNFPDAAGSGYNAYSNGNNNNNNNNNQYELVAAVPSQNSQSNYNNNQQPPAYAASASQGYTVQPSPVAYAPLRDHSERPLRTYSDKSPTPKPYQPDNDVDAPSSYTSSPVYDYPAKLSRPSSYAAADESSYEVEEQPRPRKTHKRPAAYVEESLDDESYSRPSARSPSKYLSSEPESDAYSGLEGSTSYHQPDLSYISKTASSSLPSYATDSLDDADLTSLGLQAYSSPSLPQSELSYLMSKMPRGFSPVPAASSYDLPAPRLRYPFGFPSRPAARRPYPPGPYAPSPYLKSPYIGAAAYPGPPSPKLYMPAASFRHYSSTPYYGAASSPVPASSPFRLSSAVAGGLSLGKSFGSGKGLRIGPLEFGSSGSLFPSIKIKSPVRV